MAFSEERYIQQLVAMYRTGFQAIVESIRQSEAKGRSIRYQKEVLSNVGRILQQMDEYADRWIEQVVGGVYSASVAETIAQLRSKGITTEALGVSGSFAAVHQRAIDVIAQNMSDNLRNATQFVGRRIQDIFREVSLEQTGLKLVTGASWQELKKKLVQELIAKGQIGFKDKSGRQWRLDSYAELVARTTTREAASVAIVNQCNEYGHDLVQITTHYPTCEICAPLQGKVFSLQGEDKRYPKLTDEYRPPIHPNCRHVLVPYVRELDPDAEDLERFSNTPLDKDSRTEDEKQAYKEMRDKVTIKRIRRRSREVLYNPSASPKDKEKAAKELDRTYKKTGKRPTGRDGKILKQYRLKEDRKDD